MHLMIYLGYHHLKEKTTRLDISSPGNVRKLARQAMERSELMAAAVAGVGWVDQFSMEAGSNVNL